METYFLPPPIPSTVYGYFPKETDHFLSGVYQILKDVLFVVAPDIAKAGGLCLSIFAIIILIGFMNGFAAEQNTYFVGAAVIIAILLRPFDGMIEAGIEGAMDICEYAKLLLPVITSALAAQGGVSTATGLYAITAILNIVLSTLLQRLFLPGIYAYLAVCIGAAITKQETIGRIANFIRWGCLWLLKTVLYVFTGFLGISGIISGAVDASTLKVARMTISGTMPIVGGILSDASEAVLVSMGMVKNAAGIYGMLAIIAIGAKPILTTFVQYFLLKITSELSLLFGENTVTKLVSQMTEVLGIVLSTIGTVCVLFLISAVCFLKGIGGL